MSDYTESYQSKLDAIRQLETALREKRTMTAQDDISINPTLASLGEEARALEAAIDADDTPELQGPDAGDVAALRGAITAAEDAIAADAAVNGLVTAATTLVQAMRAPT